MINVLKSAEISKENLDADPMKIQTKKKWERKQILSFESGSGDLQ